MENPLRVEGLGRTLILRGKGPRAGAQGTQWKQFSCLDGRGPFGNLMKAINYLPKRPHICKHTETKFCVHINLRTRILGYRNGVDLESKCPGTSCSLRTSPIPTRKHQY